MTIVLVQKGMRFIAFDAWRTVTCRTGGTARVDDYLQTCLDDSGFR